MSKATEKAEKDKAAEKNKAEKDVAAEEAKAAAEVEQADKDKAEAESKKADSKKDLTPEQAEQEQFPAQKGHVDEEIAKRSPDSEERREDRFQKSFVHQKNPTNADSWDIAELHDQNYNGVLQEAINMGLHPRGTVSFDRSEDEPDGKSIRLDYSVEVIPSSIDTKPGETMTPTRKNVIEDKEDKADDLAGRDEGK